MSAEEVRQLAYCYRAKLRLYFWPSLLVALVSGWLGAWAEHQSDWEAKVVWFGLMSVSTLALFFSLFTGILLYRWHRLSARAFAEAEEFVRNPAWFKSVFKEVIGPFPW